MLLTPMFRISSAKDKRHVVPERLPKNLLFGHQNAQDISRYVIKDRKTPNLTLKTEFFFFVLVLFQVIFQHSLVRYTKKFFRRKPLTPFWLDSAGSSMSGKLTFFDMFSPFRVGGGG